MAKNLKYQKADQIKKIQRYYDKKANSRKSEIIKQISNLKGKLFRYCFRCYNCGHDYSTGYIYSIGNEEYEICKFCKDKISGTRRYLRINYTPMGNKR